MFFLIFLFLAFLGCFVTKKAKSQVFSQLFICVFFEKVVSLPPNFQYSFFMKSKLLCVLVLACVFVQAIQAQTMIQPSNPNDACAAAWQQYEKGDKLWKTGWGLFVPGVAMATVGGTYGFTRMFGYDGSMTTNYSFIAGMTVLSAGCAMTISAIPCLVIGQKERKAAKKTIDEWNCAPEVSCEQIRLQYDKNDKLWKAGWGLFGIGGGLTILGGALAGYYSNNPTLVNGVENYAVSDAGAVLMGVGLGSLITSIPCICVGQVERKKATSMYNQHCAAEPPLTFSIQSSANGLGLAMQF